MEKFFLTYDDPCAAENFLVAKSKILDLRNVTSNQTIQKSHHYCGSLSFTDQFMVIDADAALLDTFDILEIYELTKNKENVFIFRARNPVNDLEYGHGGIKVFRKKYFNEESVIDFSTSFKDKIVSVKKTLNIHRYNTTPFHAWRTAFRECVKLSSNLILNHSDQLTSYELKTQQQITEHRLTTWCERFNDVEHVEFSKLGSLAGRDYGCANKDNFDSLMLINNFNWLKSQYEVNALSK
jgi:hypothetical protein